MLICLLLSAAILLCQSKYFFAKLVPLSLKLVLSPLCMHLMTRLHVTFYLQYHPKLICMLCA